MFHKPKGSSVPSDAQAKEKLALYVYEYLTHVGAPKAAQIFFKEIQWDRSVPMTEPPGFLFSWWSVFWDLYCAAPERRDSTEHSNEAKAFHDYGFINTGQCNGFIPGSSRINKMVSLPPEHNFRGRLIPLNHPRFPFPQGQVLFGLDSQRMRANCSGPPFMSNNIPMLHRQPIPDMRQMLNNCSPSSMNGVFYQNKSLCPVSSGMLPRHPSQLIFSPMGNFSPPQTPFRSLSSGLIDQAPLIPNSNYQNSDQNLLFMSSNRCDSRNPISSQSIPSDANSIELALSSMSNHPFIDSHASSFFPNSIDNSIPNNSTPLTMINDTSSSSIMEEPSHMPSLSDEDFLSRFGGHPPTNLLQQSNNMMNCEQSLSPYMANSSSPFSQNHLKFSQGSGFSANRVEDSISVNFHNLPLGMNEDLATAFSDLSNQSLDLAAFNKIKSNFNQDPVQKLQEVFNFNHEPSSGNDHIY